MDGDNDGNDGGDNDNDQDSNDFDDNDKTMKRDDNRDCNWKLERGIGAMGKGRKRVEREKNEGRREITIMRK